MARGSPWTIKAQLLQWGRNFIVAEIENANSCRLPWLTSLQWGRNFIVAEIHPPHERHEGQWVASMGPQLYRCGNTARQSPRSTRASRFNGAATLSLRKCPAAQRHAFGLQLASMGPQLYRCGNSPCMESVLPDVLMLQWGRNFIVAEIPSRPPTLPRHAALQWGRNFIVAEIQHPGHHRHRAPHASMGPQLYRCGNG